MGSTLQEIKQRLALHGVETDKGGDYLTFYEEFFHALRQEPIRFLEIGIHQGGSLALWAEYFPHGTVVGLDSRDALTPAFRAYVRDQHLDTRVEAILDCTVPVHTTPLEDRRSLFRGHLGDAPFDVILDDGAHTYTHTKSAFEVLFHEHLKPGGLYILEDWGTTYFPSWSDGSEAGDTGMFKMIKELCDEVALRDRMKGKGHTDLGNVHPAVRSVTVRAGQVWVEKAGGRGAVSPG